MPVGEINLNEQPTDLPANFQFENVADSPVLKREPVFGIRIGGLGLMVSTAIYCEVLDKVSVNPLPNVHPWVNGILNLRGNFVPVFDLHFVLKEKHADDAKRRLFAIDRNERAVAIWIDSFPEIIDKAQLKRTTVLPDLPQVFQRTVTEAYVQGNQFWLSFKLEDLFSTLGRHQFTSEELV